MSLSAQQMSRMLDAVTGYCTGCPEAARRVTINHTVDRFCRDVGGIGIHLGPVPLDHDDGIYFATAPYGGVVFEVSGVRINGEPVKIVAYKVFFRGDGRASVSFPFGRRNGDTLEMDVRWRPGERTSQMPPDWFDKHFDTLMHGSIAAILSQVGTAWGNPQLAQQFEAEYARDVHDGIYELRAAQSPNGKISALDPTARWL